MTVGVVKATRHDPVALIGRQQDRSGHGGAASPVEIRVMFRIEFRDSSEDFTIRIEGRIAAEFADEIRTLVARRNLPTVVVVDISDVTFVDDIGEEVLRWLARIGARFVANNFYSRHVCEALHLPLGRKVATSERPRRAGKVFVSAAESFT